MGALNKSHSEAEEIRKPEKKHEQKLEIQMGTENYKVFRPYIIILKVSNIYLFYFER